MVRNKLMGESTGHDWWHIERVRKIARKIAKEEKADLFVVDLAALLHDLADWKFNDDLAKANLSIRNWLGKEKVDKVTVDAIMHIIENMSFKGGFKKMSLSLEGQIVQDADRLDALGAIGIARAFAYGGQKGRPLYDPKAKRVKYKTEAEYKKLKGDTIGHFYDKLLVIMDMMNTKTAKKMAKVRHEFLKDYLRQFYKEWQGEM